MKKLQLLALAVALSLIVASCSSLLHILTPPPVATSESGIYIVAPVSTTNGALSTRVLGCTRFESGVILELEMLNHGVDEIITTNNTNVKIYDNIGNIYTKDNSTIKMGIGGGTRISHTTTTYPQGVPLLYTLEIGSVDRRATGFRVVEIGASSAGRLSLKPNKPITLRNILWTESNQ